MFETYVHVCQWLAGGSWAGGAIIACFGLGAMVYMTPRALKAVASIAAASLEPREKLPEGLVEGRREDGIVMGRTLDRRARVVVDVSNRHAMVQAPTREGKTYGNFIPTLLTNRGAAIVYDPKGELAELTQGARAAFGPVYIVNFSEKGTSGFNPIDCVSRSINPVAAAQNLANVIIEQRDNNPQPEFANTAIEILSALILFVAKDARMDGDRTLSKVRELTILFNKSLDMMITSEIPEIKLQAEGLKNDIEDTGKFLRNAKRDINTALNALADETVAENTSHSDFDIADIVCAERPLTIYLQVTKTNVSRLATINRVFLDCVTGLLRENNNYVGGRQKRHKLLLALDEFPELGRWKEAESLLSTAAGAGVRVMIATQSLSHIRRLYGQESAIEDNCQLQVLMQVTNARDLRSWSDKFGVIQEERVSHNESRSRWSSTHGTTTSLHDRPKFYPGDFFAIPKNETWVVVRDNLVKLRRIPYDDPEFTRAQPATPAVAVPAVAPESEAQGDALTVAIERAGSRKALAEKLGVDPRRVSDWLAGKREPSADERAALEALLTTDR